MEFLGSLQVLKYRRWRAGTTTIVNFIPLIRNYELGLRFTEEEMLREERRVIVSSHKVHIYLAYHSICLFDGIGTRSPTHPLAG